MIGDQSALTALYLTNPAAAQAIRRQQFGAQLAQGALGAEPIQAHSQGLAKLGQALVGALLMGKADTEFDELGKKQEAERARFDSLLSGALTGAPAPMPEPRASMPAQTAMAPPDLMPHFEEAAKRTGIPVPVLLAKAQQESGFNPNATGAAGEIGVTQIKPSTAQQPGFGVAPVDPASLRDPRANINFGADYLAARGRAVGVQDWNDPAQRAKAFKAYNGGGDPNYAANVERYIPQGGATVAQTSTQAPIPGNVEADLELAKRQQAVALQMSGSSDPTIRHRGDMLFRAAQAAEARAMARMKYLEGAQPDAPERHRQKLEVATAGRPSIENRVAVAGPSEAANLVAKRWDAQGEIVRKANQAEVQFRMFEKAMEGFDPGVAADVRQSALQALQELGFKNNAPQAELMKSIQRRLEFANTPKGEGAITENERALVREATNLFGSTPEGARLLMNATRELNAYDRRVHAIMTESAKRNGGAPNAVEVAEALQQLPPPLSFALEEQIRGRIQASPPTSAAGPRQFTREELEAELARRRGAR